MNEQVDDGADEADQKTVVSIEDTDYRLEYAEMCRRRFPLTCERIHQDSPRYDCFAPGIALDDHQLSLLGDALKGNTELKTLSVEFMMGQQQQQGDSVTTHGTLAFVSGVVCSQIKSLYLQGSEELPYIMALVGASRSIEEISLHFPMGDAFAKELSKSMMTTTSGTSLKDISFLVVDQMTPGAARAFSNFLRSSYVTSLTFATSAPGKYAVAKRRMKTFHSEGIQYCRDIHDLSLNGVVGNMNLLVPTLPKLCELTIEKVPLSVAEVDILSNGVRSAHRLCVLDLLGCGFNDQHMSKLSRTLGNHPSIHTLKLCNNQIGDAGVTSFVQHWTPESKINYLTLSSNNLGSKGALLLINAASSHSHFGTLDLGSNNSIGFDGLELIGRVLPDAKIQVLCLYRTVNWTKYKDVTCEVAVIQEAKCMAAGKALLEGVRGNRHLLELRMFDDLHLPPTVKDEIDLYTKANAHNGRRAAFENQHVLPSGVWCHFLAKKGMTSSMMFLFLRELPGVVVSGSLNNTNRKKRPRV